jgi:hypothetical protein
MFPQPSRATSPWTLWRDFPRSGAGQWCSRLSTVSPR